MAAITTAAAVASSVALKNGVTLNDVLLINNANINTATLTENQHPSKSPVSRAIELITYAGGVTPNSSIVVEQYSIKPNFVGLLPCSGPKKGIWYLPIPNSNFALKFYAPDEHNSQYYNIVYCVPAEKNDSYASGYKDFSTVVSPEFVSAFVKFASTLPNNTTDRTSSAVPSTNKAKSFNTTDATQSISFSFSYWGNLSGIVGKSTNFTFEFVFYPGQAPLTPTVVPQNNPTLNQA